MKAWKTRRIDLYGGIEKVGFFKSWLKIFKNFFDNDLDRLIPVLKVFVKDFWKIWFENDVVFYISQNFEKTVSMVPDHDFGKIQFENKIVVQLENPKNDKKMYKATLKTWDFWKVAQKFSRQWSRQIDSSVNGIWSRFSKNSVWK